MREFVFGWIFRYLRKGAPLLILAAMTALPSQEFVLHRFSSASPDESIEGLLYLSAGHALMKMGLSSLRGEGEYSYLLLTSYSNSKGGITVEYSLFRARGDGRALATSAATLPLDERFDSTIDGILVRLVASSGIAFVPSPLASIGGLLAPSRPAPSPERYAASPSPPPRPPEAIPPGAASPPSADASPTAEPVAGTVAEPVAGSAAREKSAPLRGALGEVRGSPFRFDSSLSAAGKAFFGAITEYCHYGISCECALGASLGMRRCTLAFDVKATVTSAFCDEGVEGGPFLLWSVGPSLRAQAGAGSEPRTGIALSGGAAFLTVGEASAMRTKTLPYAAASLFLAAPLCGSLLMGMELEGQEIFEPSAPLFSLGASLSLRLEV